MKAQYGILRFAKYKGPEIVHIEAPNERTKERYASNPDVDTSRSRYNFHLITPQRKKHQVFATNPMLLTFIIMRYPIDKTFYGKQYLFYRTAYDTLVTVHDQEKEAYSRIYHSAKDSEEFTKVFREFCAITYLDRVHEFDQATFEGYFNRLKSKAEVSNPKVMTMKNFVHDACATACMMYEEEYKILYVDPGFQEYLFAE